jgi:hypothetical protein
VDEAIAYQWAAKCLKPVEDSAESHRLQQAADLIVGAILEAYRQGRHGCLEVPT